MTSRKWSQVIRDRRSVLPLVVMVGISLIWIFGSPIIKSAALAFFTG
jgi:hypothetical protein